MNKIVGIICAIVVVIFVLAFAVGFIELSTPIVLKADFDRICSNYADVAVEEGGLSNAQLLNLKDELQKLSTHLNIDECVVSKKGTVKYKDTVMFQIKATYKQSTMINIMVRTLKSYNFSFSKRFINNKMVE